MRRRRARKYFEVIIHMPISNFVPQKHKSHSSEQVTQEPESCRSDNMVGPVSLLLNMTECQTLLSLSVCGGVESICTWHEIISF